MPLSPEGPAAASAEVLPPLEPILGGGKALLGAGGHGSRVDFIPLSLLGQVIWKRDEKATYPAMGIPCCCCLSALGCPRGVRGGAEVSWKGRCVHVWSWMERVSMSRGRIMYISGSQLFSCKKKKKKKRTCVSEAQPKNTILI